MPQRRQLDPGLKGRIIGRLEAGQKQTEVSRALDVAQSVIFRLWRQFEDTGDVRHMLYKVAHSLSNDFRCTIIWREHETRCHLTNIVGKRPFVSGGVLMWADIMFNGCTDLHIFAAGTVNAQRYRDEVLKLHVRLFRGAFGPHLIFMDDNAHLHRANHVDEYLEGEDIQCMDWPAMSTDLKPIENAWDVLGRRAAVCQPPPTTLPALHNALRLEWEQLSAELLNHLIEGMPRHCDA
ncbi:hypothetical protein ANN_22485 [Periplaneta americana]|uniref:Tc1-like transposase DDE domain-containing protein n=1 Tax=Periplaneta americana TaxID=6978 RepID=A0ABQ8S899_PERAM|nr:hypothetical protein ANN_22485 [Periplaneta americana]